MADKIVNRVPNRTLNKHLAFFLGYRWQEMGHYCKALFQMKAHCLLIRKAFVLLSYKRNLTCSLKTFPGGDIVSRWAWLYKLISVLMSTLVRAVSRQVYEWVVHHGDPGVTVRETWPHLAETFVWGVEILALAWKIWLVTHMKIGRDT